MNISKLNSNIRRINTIEYLKGFGIEINPQENNKEMNDIALRKIDKALKHALDIRKFEIDLYWKRATYFWALIAVAFAGYFAILNSSSLLDKEYMAFIVGCIGLVFTFSWFLVNKGSKFWQENWENHVDMLEDYSIGPLYKTILRRPNAKELKKAGEDSVGGKYYLDYFITGPCSISPSKIAQFVSLFTLIIWFALIGHVLPAFNYEDGISYKHIAVGTISASACIMMTIFGRTHSGGYGHIAVKRKTDIVYPINDII